MAFISFGIIDKKIIPIIIASISCFLNRLLKKYDKSFLFKNIIMTNICISASKFFAIIPFIIYKIRTKRVSSSDIQNLNSSKHLQLIYTDGEKKIIKEKILKGLWKYILLSAVIFTINQVLYIVTLKVETNTSTLDIVFTSLFYYLISKVKLYRHHYLSMILIIITGSSIDLFLNNLQKDIRERIDLFFLRIVRESIYSLSSVVDKYIMEKKFISEYVILLADGIFIFVLSFIFSIFDYNFFHIDNYKEYFNEFNFIELLVIFGEIITQFILNLFLLITNKVNTPCHCFTIFVFGHIAYYVVEYTEKTIIIICGLIFMLFLSLIFNEIIELNFLGLSFNTKKNIMKRALKENEEDIIRADTNESMIDNNPLINIINNNEQEDGNVID